MSATDTLVEIFASFGFAALAREATYREGADS
jgi:hypothetical protein